MPKIDPVANRDSGVILAMKLVVELSPNRGWATILSLMIDAGESCQRFMEATISKIPAQYIECDEQWAFVFCKRRTAEQNGFNTEECGDRY